MRMDVQGEGFAAPAADRARLAVDSAFNHREFFDFTEFEFNSGWPRWIPILRFVEFLQGFDDQGSLSVNERSVSISWISCNLIFMEGSGGKITCSLQ